MKIYNNSFKHLNTDKYVHLFSSAALCASVTLMPLSLVALELAVLACDLVPPPLALLNFGSPSKEYPVELRCVDNLSSFGR